MIKINLLPVKQKETKQKLMNQIAVGVLFLLAAIALMGYFLIDKRGQVSTVKADNKKVEKEINDPKYKGLEEQKKDLEKKKKRLETQTQIVNELQTGRDWFLRVLEKISEDLPADVWLDSIQFSKPKRTRSKKDAGGGNEKIVLQGRAYNEESVAFYMSNLSIIPCDDDLPSEKKSKVCQERYNACLDMAKNVEGGAETSRKSERTEIIKDLIGNAEKCKSYYVKKDEELSKAKKDVDICVNSCAARLCAEKNKASDKKCLADMKKDKKCGSDCREETNKYKQLQKENKELHEEEYVVYNEVNLVLVRKSKSTLGALSFPEYSFRIEVQQTTPKE